MGKNYGIIIKRLVIILMIVFLVNIIMLFTNFKSSSSLRATLLDTNIIDTTIIDTNIIDTNIIDKNDKNNKNMDGIYKYIVEDMNGNEISLSQYYGSKVTLVINTASKWGLTKKNFKFLSEIYNKYQDKGLNILAFPCKSFHQEFTTNMEVQQYSNEEFDIKYPLFGIMNCNGERDGNENTHPLFQYLTNSLPDGPKGKNIEWNFAKFLINDKGIPIKRFGSKEKLDIVENAIREIIM